MMSDSRLDSFFQHNMDNIDISEERPNSTKISRGVQITLTINGVLIFIIALWGNILVLRMISQRQRSSVTRNFLFNLSLTDLLSVITCLPITVFQEILGYRWFIGSFFCRFFTFIQCITVISTSFTYVVISIDRLMLVTRPLRWRVVLNLKRGKLIIILAWISGALVATPVIIVTNVNITESLCTENWPNYQLKQGYTIYLFLIQYVFPLVLLTCSYITIINKMLTHRIPGEGDVCRDKRITSAKKKMIKMMIVVSLLYAISKFPEHAVFFYFDLKNWQVQNTVEIWNTAVLLGFISSCCNPIVYAWMNRQYCIGFLQAMGPLCPKKWTKKYMIKRSLNQNTNGPTHQEHTRVPENAKILSTE